ncbi:MAG: alpha-amylase family glycosyl hydrolase [Gemmataceae bacterium]
MPAPRYPSLYQVNTRVWLTDLSRRLGWRATLDDVPNADLDRLARLGFNWVWLLSVWQTGSAGRDVSRRHPDWRKEYEETLSDLTEDDIGGSGFAITGYTVSPALGGDAALARFRQRLAERNLRLMLDFVPNHTGLDHSWVDRHPEYYITGTEDDLARQPDNYIRLRSRGGDRVFAHGRDPYFPGWPDTLQLNYANHAVQDAMIAELAKVASQCDGVRCDMAMLVLPDVFAHTWGRQAEAFWPRAIAHVRSRAPSFKLMAEVYWDREYQLQQLGFDYTYDKRLYDRLREGKARPVHDHFVAGLDFQRKLARFVENHDEPRATTAFSPEMYPAAAVVTYLAPGLRFFHQGQLDGRRKRISPHLVRGPDEPVDRAVREFYDALLAVLQRPAVREGDWRLVECAPAWDGNPTWDDFLAFSWRLGDERLLAVVNYAAHPSQCYARPGYLELHGRTWQLEDLLGTARYERSGDEMAGRGLYLDLAPWQAQVFALTR